MPQATPAGRQAETLAPDCGATIGQAYAVWLSAPACGSGLQGIGPPHQVAVCPPPAVDVLMHGLGGAGQAYAPLVAWPLAPVTPVDPHIGHIGGGGEHWLPVAPVAGVAPRRTQHDLHIAPEPATASGCGQGGGRHDVGPLAPVAPPVHRSRTKEQMQPRIAGRPRNGGCVPLVPVVPVVPVEPVAGHGLHTTGELAPRGPKSRAMLFIGPGHGWQSSQATLTEDLTIPLASDRHGGRRQRSSGRTRALGIGEPAAPLEPVAPPRAHGLHSAILGTRVEPLEPEAPPGEHGLHTTRRTIRCRRRRIGCPA